MYTALYCDIWIIAKGEVESRGAGDGQPLPEREVPSFTSSLRAGGEEKDFCEALRVGSGLLKSRLKAGVQRAAALCRW